MRVRYFADVDPVETLYRGMADNSVARIDSLLRADLVICDELGFAPLDLIGRPTAVSVVAAANERRSLGNRQPLAVRGLGPLPPEHTTAASMWTGSCTTPSSSSLRGESYPMREGKSKGGGPKRST